MTDTAGRPAAPALVAHRVVIIGGGCYGSFYLRQLARAVAKGAAAVDEVLVVDRDPACQASRTLADGAYPGLSARVVVSSWDDHLAAWLGEGAAAVSRDLLVPSPLMPHLLYDWLAARAGERWPQRRVAIAPLPEAPPTPWQRAAPDGRHYASFAEWTCPINCIEPARCPVTRGPRDWSLPVTLSRWRPTSADRWLSPPCIFHCVHRTHGVGMIAAADIVAADARIAAAGGAGAVSALVGTVSHCHGALALLTIA